jgi:hypothetical protein
MRKPLISAFMLVSTAVPLHAQTSSPDDLNRRIIERRAFEAVVWGMPVVNYDLMVQEMLSKTSGKVNQVIYWGRPLDSKNQTLTPNPDALYFIAFYNTKDGPIVLDLPPADDSGSFNANIVTVWQMPLEDVTRELRPKATRRGSPIRSAATCCSGRTSRVTALLMSMHRLHTARR